MVATAPQDMATVQGGMGRQGWIPRVALVLATVLWLVAWGRLAVVGFAQPGPWRASIWALSAGATDDAALWCFRGALQRDAIVYRLPCVEAGTGGSRLYVVGFDLATGTATMRWELPEGFQGADGPDGVAIGPAGDLTIMGHSSTAIARLFPDGTVERIAIPQEFVSVSGGWQWPLDGFRWRGEELEILYEDGEPERALLVTYQTGRGWGTPRELASPPCSLDQACRLLTATPMPEGWELRYGRAPLRPADPQQVGAEIVAIDPFGGTRIIQTLVLERNSGDANNDTATYWITPEGTFRWFYWQADSSASGVTNSGRPSLRQRADGHLELVPSPPAGLVQLLDRASAGPTMETTFASYLLTDNGLVWLPLFTAGGTGLEVERVVLFGDRWLAFHEADGGLALEERPVAAASTPGRQGSVLGRQAELAPLNVYSAPLLRAPDGTYWLLGPRGETVHVGADLQRLDGRNGLDRVRLLFAGFFGFYDYSFHNEWHWLKALGIALILFGWPLALASLALWRRWWRPADEVWWDRLFRAAIACIVLDLLFGRWFWTASGYF